MDRPLKVTVHFEDSVYHAAVEPAERADQVLLRSLYHFGIDPTEKNHWRLAPGEDERPRQWIFLDRPIGDQVSDGGALSLRRDVAGNRNPSTGSY